MGMHKDESSKCERIGSCHCSKKRKHRVRRSIKVPAVNNKLADIPPDEFSWRKYGQKPIKGSPHPRASGRRRATTIESVKGFNKKGEIWGIGKATSYYYDKPLPSKAGGSTKSYTPEFASKLSAQNQAITEELSNMKQCKLQLEQTLASQGIHITTQSCNPNSQPHNDRHVDDNESNGGNGGPQILGC